jgi:SagB-type dehydrogenase family enzyme
MQAVERYRRSRGLVLYWDAAQAVCFSPQTTQRIPISDATLRFLQSLSEWRSPEEMRDSVAPGNSIADVQDTIALLLSLGLVEREGALPPHAGWDEWSPAAAFFHFATKNGVFPEDLQQRERELVEKAKHHPQPAPTKRIDGVRVAIPSEDIGSADLRHSLLTRRTWRTFSAQPVPVAALGTLLKTTFGVHRRGHVAGQGPVILRTSPSGGSRHPIEAYVLAWNIDGLAPGAYHFDSASSELVDLQRSIAATDIPALLAHQTYFGRAAAAVIMCPVFARTQWRYGHSRAYRTVLLDAGHLGQTFCVVATALGLAPFTTMAFSEATLEGLLGLDGIRECPIYVVGVGMPDPAAEKNPGRWDRGGS